MLEQIGSQCSHVSLHYIYMRSVVFYVYKLHSQNEVKINQTTQSDMKFSKEKLIAKSSNNMLQLTYSYLLTHKLPTIMKNDICCDKYGVMVLESN